MYIKIRKPSLFNLFAVTAIAYCVSQIMLGSFKNDSFCILNKKYITFEFKMYI